MRAAAGRRPAADLACGRGRNALAAAAAGIPVLAFDRSAPALEVLRAAARARSLPVAAARTDLETPFGIPVAEASCGAIFVFRFLFRPLAPAIERALAPGGLLLYETFTEAQATLPRGPSRPAFLLRPGELPTLFPGLETLEHWEGVGEGSPPEHLARLLARRAN